jgi:hypothetical protein
MRWRGPKEEKALREEDNQSAQASSVEELALDLGILSESRSNALKWVSEQSLRGYRLDPTVDNAHP